MLYNEEGCYKIGQSSSMKDGIRAFIAVEMPTQIRDGLAEIRRQLKRTGADARWVKPSNVHLTLRFLGNDVPSRTVDAIGDLLHNHLKSVQPFRITVGGLGAFPNVMKPRVVWVGIQPRDGPLPALRTAVEEAVEEAGWTREDRAFAPHLTLGRIKSQSTTGKLRRLLEKGTSDPIGSMVVSSVALIRSELTPSGPVYETLTTVTLKPRE